MPLDKLDLQRLRDRIRDRWQIVDWDKLFPWWRLPADVRILIYADGSARFNGGPFMGIQYVYTLLTSRAYAYVRFHVDFVHRDGSDPTATIAGAKKLGDLDIMNKYDQIWFFGTSSAPRLDPAEVTLLTTFMAAPKSGGVLMTGDHASLGAGIGQQVPRAGLMRQLPAPDAVFPIWNTTLEEGPDTNTTFDFDDQSDDKPQTIRYRKYGIGSGFVLERRYRPHPLLCGPDGPINILPDHQHEGEAVAPVVAPGDPVWPTKTGHQEKPEVIAWGRIKDPAADKAGQEIGVISAYDGHNVDVGRIAADSTWHHWFDINLTGLPTAPYDGFDATPAGQAALKKIDAYFLNVGVWLSPPARQIEMRNAGWWAILWTDHIFELSPKLPLWYLGEQAIDALGRMASRCTLHEWIFLDKIFKEKIPRWEWPQLFGRLPYVHLPLERYVAGGILKSLSAAAGSFNAKAEFPNKPASDEVINRAIEQGTQDGMAAMGKDLAAQLQLASRWIDAGFRAEKLRGD